MNLLKLSDASKVIPIFMADSSTKAGKPGLTPAVTLSKNGAAFAAAAGAVTELAAGHYYLTPTSADSGTLGPLVVRAAAAGADDFAARYAVVAYDPYDGVRLGLTTLPNSAKMALLHDSILAGAVSADAAATTTSFTANATGTPGLAASAGFYANPNSLVVFTSGALKGKTTRVTAYAAAGSVGTFTVAALPAAPATADTFEILSLG